MSDDQRSDSDLMLAVAGGSRVALAALVRRHQASVLRVAYRFLGRWDLAEDVAQDVFLRVLAAASTYRPTAKFSTWLARIAIHRCLDLRRRGRRAPRALEAVSAQEGSTVPAEEALAKREVAGRVREAVLSLQERQRVAVVLHRYEGLSHREIAGIMACSESAVESLLVRGYAQLRQALAPLWEEPPPPDAGNAPVER
ncbi:MAG: RNA polymerase sigma factor [Planctomycetes bacterium]|nr:RNA polymerase sigma factor [Planctomycetota bacterium]